MSNKTQLQTNNTNLDALIARVNTAKDTAASLPEVGSGGSGGASIETVTFTVLEDGPFEYWNCIDMYYLDDTGNLIELTMDNFPIGFSANVMKNSLLYMSGAPKGGVVKIPTSTTTNLYKVTGDFYVYANY